MGCDYYIVKCLQVYYDGNPNLKNMNYFTIKLEQDRGYFGFDYDEDMDDYEDKYSKYVNQCLTPKMEPIIVYDNNNFINTKLEMKYKSLIDYEISKHGKNWSEITKIIKSEYRYKR